MCKNFISSRYIAISTTLAPNFSNNHLEENQTWNWINYAFEQTVLTIASKEKKKTTTKLVSEIKFTSIEETFVTEKCYPKNNELTKSSTITFQVIRKLNPQFYVNNLIFTYRKIQKSILYSIVMSNLWGSTQNFQMSYSVCYVTYLAIQIRNNILPWVNFYSCRLGDENVFLLILLVFGMIFGTYWLWYWRSKCVFYVLHGLCHNKEYNVEEQADTFVMIKLLIGKSSINFS